MIAAPVVPPLLGSFTFDGKKITTQANDTLASALHRSGVKVLGRSLKYHRPRGLYCGAGSCGSCLVDVDGEPNVAACTRQADGANEVRSQNRLGSARRDLLGIVDKVYAKGFDPHGAFTKPRILNEAFLHAVRFMSGVGKAPDAKTSEAPANLVQISVNKLIVGGGKLGLEAFADDCLLVDENRRLGGTGCFDPTEKSTRALANKLQAHERVWTNSLVFGIYQNQAGVVLNQGLDEKLAIVTFEKLVLATGKNEGVALFDGNDKPGVMTLRAAQSLAFQFDVAPGKLVAAHGELPESLVTKIVELGGEVVAQGNVTKTKGTPEIQRALIDDQWVVCDTVICNVPTANRTELLQQAGIKLQFAPDGSLTPAEETEIELLFSEAQ